MLTRSRWAVRLAAGAVLLLPPTLAGQVPARDSVVYELSPASQLEVETGTAGLFGFAGHEHRIRARTFSGEVIYFPEASARSRVEIVVLADSLFVLTPEDTAEIRKVTEAMRTETLQVDRYRDIVFRSTGLSFSGDSVSVQGELTLVGQTRDVRVGLRVDIGIDTLRASGTFSVKQTDFGIRPYRAGPGGTVRVADRVRFTITVLGIRLAAR
jgi:polyisoprenoid-binding protein YceI